VIRRVRSRLSPSTADIARPHLDANQH
jgi:hypothetical protein